VKGQARAMATQSRNRQRIEFYAGRLAGAAKATQAATEALLASCEAGIEGTSNTPFNDPSNGATAAAAFRARHKSGGLSKIEADPELRTFVVARIHVMTFNEIAKEVAKAFPPKRRVALSSVHRWRQSYGQFLPVQSAKIGSDR
jgi:hypothetical protein